MTQMGFFDLSDRCASLDVKNDTLIKIDSAVGSEEFRETLERVWRKPMDSVLMFKIGKTCERNIQNLLRRLHFFSSRKIRIRPASLDGAILGTAVRPPMCFLKLPMIVQALRRT